MLYKTIPDSDRKYSYFRMTCFHISCHMLTKSTVSDIFFYCYK